MTAMIVFFGNLIDIKKKLFSSLFLSFNWKWKKFIKKKKIKILKNLLRIYKKMMNKKIIEFIEKKLGELEFMWN